MDTSRARIEHGVAAALKGLMVGVCLLVLSACAQLPHKNIVKGPTTIEPPARPDNSMAADGSIFRSGYSKTLFDDRRPNQIGDLLTVVLNEDVSATKSSSANAGRNSSLGFDPVAVPEVLGDSLGKQAMDLSGKSDFSGKGGAEASNSFTGRITVTVMQVLANGNLKVAGEKNIGINKGVEHILFSGVVDPRLIDADGTIPSTKVADVRLDYYADGFISETEEMGWLHRFLINISPF